jgi:hypothetical protein
MKPAAMPKFDKDLTKTILHTPHICDFSLGGTNNEREDNA